MSKIFCNKNFYVDTYTIGYKNQGESIVILLFVDDKCIFSCVVDSYLTKDFDIVKRVLSDNKIEALNIICWTHPHDDHSVGMENLIQTYSNEHTEVWIPENVMTEGHKVSATSKKLFEELKKEITAKSSTYRVCSASDKKDMLYRHAIGSVVKDQDLYEIEMCTLAPSSQSMIEETLIDSYVENEESIVFYLMVGNAYFIFTGDANSDSLSSIPREELPEHVHFVKIPHHGSYTSQAMLNLLTTSCDISSSTVYRVGKSHLPENDILKNYLTKSRTVLCTGKSKDLDECDYGIVHCRTDIIKQEYQYEVEGNACEFF